MRRHARLLMLVALFVVVPAVAGAAAPFAYITNSGTSANPGNVVAIDTATHSAVGLAMPSDGVRRMPWGVALNRDGSRLYVTHLAASGTLMVFDTATRSLIAEVPVGSNPYAVAVNPVDGTIFVSVNGSGAVRVLDPATFAMSSIAIGSPRGVAVDAAGKRLYAASYSTRTLAVYDAATRAFITSYNTGLGPVGVALAQDGSRVYVTNEQSNSLSIIHLASGAITHAAVGTRPLGVAVSPDGSRVYVANSGSATLSVLDADGNRVRGDVMLGNFPFGVATDGQKVFVAARDASRVYVLDMTGALLASLTANRPIAFGQFVLQPEAVITVGVDVMPGGNPNVISLRARGGVLPVAILGAEGFNVADVDPATVTLAGASVALRGNGLPMAHEEDVNDDGFMDLVVHVVREELQLQPGDTEAVLLGRLYSGKRFKGTDTVRVIR